VTLYAKIFWEKKLKYTRYRLFLKNFSGEFFVKNIRGAYFKKFFFGIFSAYLLGKSLL